MTRRKKNDLIRILGIVGCAILGAYSGCALHNPVPVEPDYPPLASRDAGKEAKP